ncbi:MAG: chemotaxis protein CheW [Gammaproteobacteria bacterium]|nr:chemotaxis protein CheW [Gammaproteobacteria bacterium]
MAENTSDFVPCMLIPLQQHYLLLPNSTIAEVIPMPRLSSANDKPNYWVGECNWHEKRLPVIDLESLVENEDYDMVDAHKLCVLHGINNNVDVNTYALPCYGIPQLIHLNESALKLAQDSETSDFLHYKIQIGKKEAYIPNLDKIEETLSQ